MGQYTGYDILTLLITLEPSLTANYMEGTFELNMNKAEKLVQIQGLL